METCESDTEVYEDCVSNFSDIPSSRGDELKTMDFEDCSFDEDSFNESMKNKPHSTMLFSNVDRLVQRPDDEDMEHMECSYSEEIKSDTCDDNSVKSISSLQNLKPQFKTGLNVKWLKKKKSSNKPFESSAIIVDSSIENSPVIIRKSVKLKNRIINSVSEDADLTTDNVSRISVSAFDNSTINVTNKFVNKSGHSRNSYSQNVTTQNCMGHEENKHSSRLGCEDVSDKSLSSNSESEQDINAGTNVITSTLLEIGTDSENKNYSTQIRQDDNVTVTSAVKAKSNNSQCRHSDVIIINSDSDESDFQHNSDKNLTQLIGSCSMQDDNISIASVIEVVPNKFQGRPSDVISINSDSDEDDVQHVQTEYCDQNLNIPTRHGRNDNVPNMFSKQVLGNDLATRVESLLAEDEWLKLQIAEALRIVENSQVRIEMKKDHICLMFSFLMK